MKAHLPTLSCTRDYSTHTQIKRSIHSSLFHKITFLNILVRSHMNKKHHSPAVSNFCTPAKKFVKIRLKTQDAHTVGQGIYFLNTFFCDVREVYLLIKSISHVSAPICSETPLLLVNKLSLTMMKTEALSLWILVADRIKIKESSKHHIKGTRVINYVLSSSQYEQ